MSFRGIEEKANDSFLDIEELTYIMLGEYPDLKFGVDYVLAQYLSPDGKVQTQDAFFYAWNREDVPMPHIDVIRAKWDQYKPTYLAWHKAAELRQWRDTELTKADSKVYIAEDHGDFQAAADWRTYKQALRDLPDQVGFPLKVTIPVSPDDPAFVSSTAAVPFKVSRFQAKAALFQAGLLDQVEALMASPDTSAIYKLAWVEAQDFERRSPTVNALGAALGITSEQMDQLFITAAGITA